LKQRLDFSIKEKVETIDRLVVIQVQKLLNQWLDFPVEEKTETIDDWL